MNNTPNNRKTTGKKKKGIGLYILIMLVLIGTLVAVLGDKDDADAPSYDDILGYFREGEVAEFTINGIDLEVVLKDGKKATYQIPSIEIFLDDAGEWIERDRNAGTLKQNYVVETVSWWMSILPYVLIIGVFIVFWFIMMARQDGGAKSAMNFGKSRAKMATDENNKVTFIRILRLIGVIIALTTPGLYIALQLYHYKALPLKFLVTIINHLPTIKGTTPFILQFFQKGNLLPNGKI